MDSDSQNKNGYRELARRANVSLATVYRIVGRSGNVKPEIEARTRQVAAELGIELSAKPRGPYTVAFLLANRPMLHPFHAHVLVGAQTYCAERENSILFCPIQYGPDAPIEKAHFPPLFQKRGAVDGFIVSGLNTNNLLQFLKSIRAPFALLANNMMDAWKPGGCDEVWIDEVQGLAEATRYLLLLGHREVWFVQNRRFPVRLSHRGYRQAMESAGLAPRSVESDSADEQEGGYLAVKSLLSKGEKVSAIMAHSDSAARGAYQALRGAGLRIPQDVSVIGMGDRPEAGALDPPLTTLWGFPDQVGRRLAELVANRIETPDLPPQQVNIPMKLILRQSCTTPGAADRVAASQRV